MCDCIEFLRKHGLKHLEAFRFVGNLARVHELKTEYDKEFSSKSSKMHSKLSILNSRKSVSIKDVGSLLTEFLKGIKGGLLPPKNAREFAKVVSAKHPPMVRFIRFASSTFFEVLFL